MNIHDKILEGGLKLSSVISQTRPSSAFLLTFLSPIAFPAQSSKKPSTIFLQNNMVGFIRARSHSLETIFFSPHLVSFAVINAIIAKKQLGRGPSPSLKEIRLEHKAGSWSRNRHRVHEGKLCTGLLSYLSYAVQAHLLRDRTEHRGCSPSSISDEENTSQTYPQASPMEAIPQ